MASGLSRCLGANMRFEGILSAWNQEAGYGTIRPLNGGDEVFVGLRAFPTDGEGPSLDQAFSFEIVSGRDGRKQAVNLKRLAAGYGGSALREATGGGRARVRHAQKKRRLTLLAGAVVALALVGAGLQWWQPKAPEYVAKTTR